MLIDTTYFFGNCSIGQLSEQSVQGKLSWFINQYEPEILQGLLGYETYKALQAVLPAPTDQKWINLLKGAEYTDIALIQRKWRGLAPDAVNGYKESPIAYYVYWQYQKSQATNTGGTGENLLQAENASPVSPADKMMKAWNQMVFINRELFDFLYANQADYPDWFASVYTRSGMFGAYRQLNAEKFLTTQNRFS